MNNHEDETAVGALKDMLGKAIRLGMSVSEEGITGSIFDDRHKMSVSGVGALEESTSRFLSASGLEGIDSNEIIPLYREVATQLSGRRT